MAKQSKLINGKKFRVNELVEVEDVDCKWRARILSFRKDSSKVVLKDTSFDTILWRDEKNISKLSL